MKPRIGILLGDPNGIGPELIAKLIVQPDIRETADILLIGDRHVLEAGADIAGLSPAVTTISDPGAVRWEDAALPLLEIGSIRPEQVTPGEATAEGGASCVRAMRVAVDLAKRRVIDGFCFAPMNKYALRLGGNPYEDEHVFFARELGFDGPFCEHNVLGDLWTTRVTSHIPLAEVVANITPERILRAIRLAHNTLGSAGIEAPRIAVAALNPHAGDGGMFGREEIDIIAPTIEAAQGEEIDASGPFPADTVFVKARDGQFDAVVTMYHDQGQVAMKLMGFKRGVTVSGGLPVPITTPASGTAFDIVGRNKATADGMRQAFLLVCRMAAVRLARERVASAD